MKRWTLAAIAVAILAAALPLVAPADLTERNSRKPVPDFTLDDSSGAKIQISAYKGRVVLLDFWATWCTGCKTEIPWYMEFVDQYKDRGFAAVGVALDEDGWKSVRPYLAEHKINYPIVVGDKQLSDRFGVDAMPVTVLIDRDGNIADSHSGMVDKSAFAAEIETLVRETPRKPAN